LLLLPARYCLLSALLLLLLLLLPWQHQPWALLHLG
jgi:hypothetical protein